MREVFEETGLHIRPHRKVLTQAADTKVKTVSFWLVETDSYAVRLDSKSSAFGWFTLTEALQLLLYPGTKTFFEKVQAGKIDLGLTTLKNQS